MKTKPIIRKMRKRHPILIWFARYERRPTMTQLGLRTLPHHSILTQIRCRLRRHLTCRAR
jgi:hypothetical protein